MTGLPMVCYSDFVCACMRRSGACFVKSAATPARMAPATGGIDDATAARAFVKVTAGIAGGSSFPATSTAAGVLSVSEMCLLTASNDQPDLHRTKSASSSQMRHIWNGLRDPSQLIACCSW